MQSVQFNEEKKTNNLIYIPNKGRIWVERLAAWWPIPKRIQVDGQTTSEVALLRVIITRQILLIWVGYHCHTLRRLLLGHDVLSCSCLSSLA